MKRKDHRWKFSQGGGWLFILFLFAPFVFYTCALFWKRPESGSLLMVFTLISLAWLAGAGAFFKSGMGRIPRSWYEAGFGTGLIYLFYATWIFVTGYTPTKFNSHPIAREAGFIWLYLAVLPLSIGAIAYAIEKIKDRH